ncbi:MAG: hypothetical protein RIS94_1866 [Pseudomonadota bacterium]
MTRRSTRTSRAAIGSMGSVADTLRALSYRLIHEAGAHGMTALEVVTASGRERWGIQPRISELVSDKAIVDSGRTRTNPSGREAIVWVLPEYGPQGGAA